MYSGARRTHFRHRNGGRSSLPKFLVLSELLWGLVGNWRTLWWPFDDCWWERCAFLVLKGCSGVGWGLCVCGLTTLVRWGLLSLAPIFADRVSHLTFGGGLLGGDGGSVGFAEVLGFVVIFVPSVFNVCWWC